MAPNCIVETLAELGVWAEPIVVDMLHLAYCARSRDGRAPPDLVRRHALIWRAIFAGADDIRRRHEVTLGHGLSIAGFGRSHFDYANARVIEELAAIIDARTRCSPRSARRFHRTLLSLRARLEPLKIAA